MKKNILLIMLIFGLGLMVACESDDFLDETQTTDLDEETVFSDSTYTTAFLTQIYTQIGFSSEPSRFSASIYDPDGGLQTACDEGEPRQSSDITTDVQFITGTVNSVIVDDDAWSIPYEYIRKVNVFLKHLPESPLSSSRKKRFEAEARFLRAWYYSILLKHYGGIPLIGDTVFTDPEEIDATRDTYEDCVNYIVSECDEAAKYLSNRPSGREYGRVGAGACKALKARVLLYAASPLFNGSDFAPEACKELLGYPTYDVERWRIAMEAARDVISMGVYSLYVDNDEEPGRGFYRIFLASDWASDGAFNGTILEKKAAHGTGRESLFQPPSRGGDGGGYPYQELVDAFGMSNGKAISDLESGYDEDNPYANRDPRLYNSVIYDQAPLRNGATLDVPVNIYIGNYSGVAAGQDAVYTGTPTGYYFNKMLHREIAANYFIGGPQSRPLIRYAEILLNYAEAKNEYEGPTSDVYEAVEAVRERAGLDPYKLPEGLSQNEMREVIRDERRVEFAVEGQRFWDVRRWMIAGDTESQMMTGMEVKRDGDNVKYTRFDVRKHVFRKAMYFWPIPYTEIAKSPELLQNPYY